MKIKSIEPTSSVTFNTSNKKKLDAVYKWWKASSKDELCGQLLSTAAYLKSSQQYRYRQAAIYARLYGNMSLFNFIGSNISKIDNTTGLPQDRPTFNVIQSAVDTLISRISQQKPTPVFLTDNSDYKERNLAKKLNNFIQGEFYRCKAHEKAAIILRDALVEGVGALKVYETIDHKVGLERVLLTELLVDPNEAMYGEPRQLFQLKLVDRDVLKEMAPGFKADIDKAAQAYPDNSADSSKTVSDLVMVVEGWHLPSAPGAKDGRHTLACSTGTIFDEKWEKDKFPFIFLHYSNRLLGFWSQGLAEQIMGTQIEINSLLYTISKAIKLVGVPRVFVEDGSKVLAAAFNNEVGSIIKYRGTKPVYEVAPCVPEELYAQLGRLIQYAYQQCGVSALDASSQKPAGLDSGEAIRTYEDISTDRFYTLSKKFDDFYVDMAYQVLELAKDICEEQGEYQTIFPNKNGIKEINLPDMKILDNPYVVQCFNTSSLPRDPAGRMAKIAEMIQAGMITIKEGRRLLDYPDLDQIEKLANASEERIFQYLDDIVEEGKYQGPDPFMDLALAKDLVVSYYNLYVSSKMEEDKCQMLRDFYSQCLTLIQAATPPPPPMAPVAPQAKPKAQPTSPNIPMAGAPSPANPATSLGVQ